MLLFARGIRVTRQLQEELAVVRTRIPRGRRSRAGVPNASGCSDSSGGLMRVPDAEARRTTLEVVRAERVLRAARLVIANLQLSGPCARLLRNALLRRALRLTHANVHRVLSTTRQRLRELYLEIQYGSNCRTSQTHKYIELLEYCNGLTHTQSSLCERSIEVNVNGELPGFGIAPGQHAPKRLQPASRTKRDALRIVLDANRNIQY